MPSMTFYSLQGLGNSMLNFPALVTLRRHFSVEVVCYQNGSSAFFSDFHKPVIPLKSKFDILKLSPRQKTDASFVSYPTWKKELSAALLGGSTRKHFMRSTRWPLTWIPGGCPGADPRAHDIENNALLVKQILGRDEYQIDLSEAFGHPQSSSPRRTLAIHPTASAICKYYTVEFWRDLFHHQKNNFEAVDIYCANREVEVDFCKRIRDVVPSPLKAELKVGLAFSEIINHLAAATQFVGTDSSLMHLASLLDCPTMGLWSFADYRVIYPYGNRSKVYIPRETMNDKKNEYTAEPPPYIARARGHDVSQIIDGQGKASFTIKPKFKNTVEFFTY